MLETEKLSNKEICHLLYNLEKDENGQFNRLNAANHWKEMQKAGMTKKEVEIHKDDKTTFSLIELEAKLPQEVVEIFGKEKAELVSDIIKIFN
jgi:hypothetical protein